MLCPSQCFKIDSVAVAYDFTRRSRADGNILRTPILQGTMNYTSSAAPVAVRWRKRRIRLPLILQSETALWATGLMRLYQGSCLSFDQRTALPTGTPGLSGQGGASFKALTTMLAHFVKRTETRSMQR